MAYRVRFYMEMNAREAMHVIELRSAPQGHPAYRRVCQQMHTLIAEQAGHRAIAEAMRFTDHSKVELERLSAERALERKRDDSAVTADSSTNQPRWARWNDAHDVEAQEVIVVIVASCSSW